MEFNNCNELLAYLFRTYNDCRCAFGNYIMFQGKQYEIGGFMPSRWCILMPSIKFPRTVFCIDDNCDEDDQFILYIYKGDSFVIDQTLGIKLPNYIKDELIATIQGYC